MALYFDASALVKLTLPEDGSQEALELWFSGARRVSSVVAFPEVLSALAAAVASRRISQARLERAVGWLERRWPEVDLVSIDVPLSLFCGALSLRHGLRALDAVHLGSLLTVATPESVLVSWDLALRRAALAEGVDVFPA